MDRTFSAAFIFVALASPTFAQFDIENPTTANEYYNRGMRHEDAKRYDEALADYAKAIELDSQRVDPWFTRSSLYAEQEEYRKAVADLSKILEINPRYYFAWFNRGLYHEYLREYDKAIADYTQAADPKNDFSLVVGSPDEYQALALHYRGRAYQWYKKDNAKAVADYTRTLQLDPSIRMVHYRRGSAYSELKKYAEAEQDFEAALKLDPDYPNLLANWAWQLSTCPDSKFRDGRKAVMLATKANKRFKFSKPTHVDTLAAAFAEDGQFDEAVETQEKAISLLKAKDVELKKAMERRLALYKQERPFRDE